MRYHLRMTRLAVILMVFAMARQRHLHLAAFRENYWAAAGIWLPLKLVYTHALVSLQAQLGKNLPQTLQHLLRSILIRAGRVAAVMQQHDRSGLDAPHQPPRQPRRIRAGRPIPPHHRPEHDPV